MKVLAALLLMTIWECVPANSQNINSGHHVYMHGTELLNECLNVYDMPGQQGSTQATHCLGFLAGFLDGATYGSSLDACIPQEVDLGQLVRVVVKYLEDHPKVLHLSAAKLIDNATLEAFPCKK